MVNAVKLGGDISKTTATPEITALAVLQIGSNLELETRPAASITNVFNTRYVVSAFLCECIWRGHIVPQNDQLYQVTFMNGSTGNKQTNWKAYPGKPQEKL